LDNPGFMIRYSIEFAKNAELYYKISTIIKVLLANITPRAFLPQPKISQNNDQLKFTLNYEL
jgi:hypothetical protein